MMEKDQNTFKQVLISGAAGGLGKELVKIFAEKGYKVIALDLKKSALSTEARNTTWITADITKINEISTLKNDLNLESTGLDILISAAGLYDTFPLTEADPGLFSKMMNVNLMGTVNLVQSMFGPLVLKKGKVVVVTSESYKVQALFQPYMITKASLEAYCIAARQELSLKGVSLTVVRPGAINTPLLNWIRSPGNFESYPIFKSELKMSWERSVKMVGRITSPEIFAKKIFRAATKTRPKRIYRIRNNPLLHIVALIPGGIKDWAVKRLFSIR